MSASFLYRFSLRRIGTYGLLAATVFAVAVGCGEEVPDTTGPDPTPAITIALNPTAASVNQGGSTTVTATVTGSGGFTGSATVAVEGAPSGVTGSVSNVQTSGAVTTATVTLDVGAAVALDTYDITVRGSGTGVAAVTATFSLTVNAAPDYALSLAPAALSIEQGQTGQSTVTLTRTNFTGAVTLSLSNAPAGVTGAFDPAAPTGAASTLTVTVGAAVAAGDYNLEVEGSGSAGDRETPLTLTVTEAPAPDYSLSLTPDALTIEQGLSGQSTVTLTRSNFGGSVSLSLGNAPAGVTHDFSADTWGPGAPTGATSTLTLTVGAAVAPGVYNLTVDGTGNPVGDRSTPLTLTVTELAETYSLSADPEAITVEQGETGQSTVTITRSNFAGAVTLALDNAPAGVTATFDPAAPTGTSSTMTVTVGAAVTPGVYNLTVDGTASAGDRSTPLTLTVTAAADYSLSLDPDALTIEQGETGQSTVTLTRINFGGSVSLSLGNAPAGVTDDFSVAMWGPGAPTGATSTLTLTVGAAVAPGVYNLTVDGSGSPVGDRSTPLTLTVTAAADYSLSLEPDALTIEQGETGQSTVTITRTNFAEAVTLSLGNAPAGVTATFDPAAPTGTSSTMTLTVGAAVATGDYNLTVDGTGSAGDRSTGLTLTVTATGFTLSMNPASVSVLQGGSTSSTANITRTAGFSETVTLTVTGMPAGMTAVPTPASTAGTSSTLDITASGGVAAASYTLTIHGNASGLPEETTTLGVTVSVSGGGNVTVDFSSCDLVDRPVWVAAQNGAGAWNQVVGSSDVYTFSITESKGGVAYVALDNGDALVQVLYRTQAEMLGLPFDFCATSGTKTINGTFAGIGAGENGRVSLGSGTASSFIDGAFQLTGVEAGSYDLVGYKSLAFTPGTTARMLLRRDQDITDGGTLGTVDFAGTEAFDPVSGSMTLSGLGAGETIFGSMSYVTATPANACQVGPLYVGFAPPASPFTVYGAPGARQNADDAHLISLNVTGTNGTRTINEYFLAMGARTLTLGSELPVPTITTLGGGSAPYKRLQSSYTMPADYTSTASLTYVASAVGKAVFVYASAGWLGGLSITLSLDDFSGVTGWNNDWAPALTDVVDYSVGGSGATGSACGNGTRIISATRTGTN